MMAPVAKPETVTPLTRFITLGIHVLAATLLLRAALIFLGASVEQPAMAGLVALTEPLASIFQGIFAQPSDDAGILPIDLGALLAALALEGCGFLVRAVARRAIEVP